MGGRSWGSQEGTPGAVKGGLGRSWGGFLNRLCLGGSGFPGNTFCVGSVHVCGEVTGRCLEMAYGEPRMASKEPGRVFGPFGSVLDVLGAILGGLGAV